MKLKINPFLGHSLIENAPYILMTFIILVSFYFVPQYMINKYFKNKAEIGKLEEKINQDKIKQKILLASQNEEIQNLDEDIRILRSLIPDSENYFTIVYSLEELSNQTNFIITSYSLNLANSNPDKISITINGSGDQEAFLRFLENYNFAGGRLITAEKIDFNQNQPGGSNIVLNFYNKKVSSKEELNVDYEKVLRKIAEIRPKVNISLQNTEDNISGVYPVKTNPF